MLDYWITEKKVPKQKTKIFKRKVMKYRNYLRPHQECRHHHHHYLEHQECRHYHHHHRDDLEFRLRHHHLYFQGFVIQRQWSTGHA